MGASTASSSNSAAHSVLQAIAVEAAQETRRDRSSAKSMSRMLAVAARKQVGKRARQMLGVSVGKKLWKASKKDGPCVEKPRGRKNIVDGAQTLAAVLQVLTENSYATSMYRRTPDGKYERIRGLSSSLKRIWRNSDRLRKFFQYDAFLRHCRKHQKGFRRLKKKVDVCTFCHKLKGGFPVATHFTLA